MQSVRNCSKKICKISKSMNSLSKQSIPQNLRDIEIVVVGAGLAGLTATNHLIENGFRKVHLLEATDRYGGRVNTKHFGDVYCELGAKWIPFDLSKHTMYNLMQSTYNLQKQIKQVKEIHNMIYVDPLGQRVDDKIPERIVKLFRKICAGINVKEKFKNGSMFNLDSVQTYFQSESEQIVQYNFTKAEQPVARDIFNAMAKEFSSNLGCCLEYVSIEHITKLPVQSINPIYIPNGLDNVLNHITSNIDDDQLITGRPVGIIKWHSTDKSFVGCMDGSCFEADHVICTLPLGVLKNFNQLMFIPPLPKEKTDAIHNIGFGNPVKLYFEYTEHLNPWFIGNIRPLKSTQEICKERKWTDQILEISKLPKSNRVLEILVGGGFYEEIEKLPDTQLVEELTNLLKSILKNYEIPYPTSILRSNWNSSACFLGGRPYFSIRSTSDDVTKLSKPLGVIPRLLFAGDATILNGFGTIDGARLSGIREAERIINHYTRRL